MWFSVVSTLIDNDTRRHSGQNVVDSRGAAKWVRNKLSYITKRARFALVSASAAYTHGQIVDAELANQSARFALVML